MKGANHGGLNQQRAGASAQRPPPHARISVSRRSRAGEEPPSPQRLANSSAPATHRLIKAMHLFMTELIKQRKRWSPLWKHISPRGNRLWSRSPRAFSGHRLWICVTYEETVKNNNNNNSKEKKHQFWGDGVTVRGVLQGIFESAQTGPIITPIGLWPGGLWDISPSGLVLCIFFLGELEKTVSLRLWRTSLNAEWQVLQEEAAPLWTDKTHINKERPLPQWHPHPGNHYTFCLYIVLAFNLI